MAYEYHATFRDMCRFTLDTQKDKMRRDNTQNDLDLNIGILFRPFHETRLLMFVSEAALCGRGVLQYIISCCCYFVYPLTLSLKKNSFQDNLPF